MFGISRLGIAFFLLFCLGITASKAQFVPPGGGSGGGGGVSSANSSVRDQPDNVTDTFSGITFQVERIVRDPGHENGLRLIMRIIETEKQGRRVSWVQPPATLSDEMGNLYYAAQTNGVPVCYRREAWDLDSDGCARSVPNVPVFLTPSQPLPVVILFLPFEQNFSPDLAAMAAKASFKARIGIFSGDMKTTGFYDITINGIELPQGGG